MHYQQPDAFQMPAWAQELLGGLAKENAELIEQAMVDAVIHGEGWAKISLDADTGAPATVAIAQQKKRGWPKGKPRK